MRHVALSLAVLMLPLCGCGWNRINLPKKEYSTVGVDPHRDTESALRKNAQALTHLKGGHFELAENLLRDALVADPFLGPAHNNLGTAYYHQKKFYLAAWEYQYAIKLMPHNVEPRNNLGMVLEAVRKFDDAAQSYEEALALQPDNPQIIGNLARLYVRTNRKDERTAELLNELIAKDTRPEWVSWARGKLVTMGRPTGTPGTSQPEGFLGQPADGNQ